MELTKKTVYLSDIEMENVSWVLCCPFMLLVYYFIFVSLPSLEKCQIFLKELVDPLLVDTYAELPKLPRYVLCIGIGISESLIIFSFRMADFSSTWGPRSEQGGYKFSQIESLYKSPDMKWVKKLSFCCVSVNVNGGLDILRPLSLSAMTRLEP